MGLRRLPCHVDAISSFNPAILSQIGGRRPLNLLLCLHVQIKPDQARRGPEQFRLILGLCCSIAVPPIAVKANQPAAGDSRDAQIANGEGDGTRVEAAGSLPASTEKPDDVLKNPNAVVTFAGPWQSDEQHFAEEAIQVIEPAALSPPPVSSPSAGILTAAATADWRQVISAADQRDKAIAFGSDDLAGAVGLTVSANRLGRNPGIGSVRNTVAAFFAATPDGNPLANASRTTNPDLFLVLPGSFNAVGIPRQIAFPLIPNLVLEREAEVMPSSQYPAYFRQHIAGPAWPLPSGDPVDVAPTGVVLHEAILYPPSLETARVVSWVTTGKPVTESRRMATMAGRPWWVRALAGLVLHGPDRNSFRRWVADPLFYADRPVVRLNYALTGGADDILALSPATPGYGRQEYYVPVERFDDFRQSLAAILGKYRVPVVAVTVRFARADRESVMAWAKTDVFGFAVTFEETEEATAWSGEAIEAALALGGSFDLASQMKVATVEQIYRAYPKLADFLTWKFQFDPVYRFHDAFCDLVIPNKDVEILFDSGKRDLQRSEALWASYGQLREQAQAMHISELGAIAGREEIGARLELVGRELAANRACRDLWAAENDESHQSSELIALGVPEALARVLAHRVHVEAVPCLAHDIRDRDIDERAGTALQAMLLLAGDHWGEWRFDSDSQRIQFAEETTAKEYGRLVAEMLECKRLEEAEDKAYLAGHPQDLAAAGR